MDHKSGFRCNRSTIDHTFCIRPTFEKEWEYNEAVHQLFIEFKKAYDSVWKEVLYNILRSCIIFPLSWCLHETGKAYINVYERNLQHSPSRQASV